MKILLTGGHGMVGKAVRRLASEVAPSAQILAPTRYELDLLDRAAVRTYLRAGSFDAIIHAGAKVGGIKANINDPIGFMTENILINTHVIEEARHAGISNLINIGSSCMYPRDFRNPLREDDILAAPLEPTNEGYAIAKIAAARLCTYISDKHGFAYRTFIPCNMYGPDDKFDLDHGHLLAAALMKVHAAHQNGESDVEIWGDGTVLREFLYVDDLARFILNSLPRLAGLPPVLNCGLGRDYTVNAYYDMVAAVIGFSGTFVHNLSAPVGMTHKLMDITLAKTYGWDPRTSVPEGLQKAYAGFLQQAARG